MVTLCLGMTCLQLWRAETRGAAFLRQQSLAQMAPITLSALHVDAQVLQGRRIVVRGSWLKDSTIFLDNKVYSQRVGYQVLTALQLEGSSAVVLVNRGWVAAPRLRTELPVVTTPSGLMVLTGIARKFESDVFEFGHPAPDGPVWQHVREAEYRQYSRLNTLPIMVLQLKSLPTGKTDDGLIRDWGSGPTADNPASRHYGYAILWGVLALVAVGYGFVMPQRA